MKNRIGKFGRNIGIFLLLVVGGLMLAVYALTLSPVQNWMVYKVKGAFERELGTEVRLMGVDAALPSYAVLEGLEIPDRTGQGFLKVGAVKIDLLNFSIWEYFINREPVHKVSVTDIQLFNPEISLYKNTRDSTYNIPIDLSLFSRKDTTTSTRPLRFVFQDVEIIQGRVRFVDSTHVKRDSVEAGRLNFRNLNLRSINSNLSMTFNPGLRLDALVSRFTLFDVNSGFKVDSMNTEIAAIFEDTLKKVEPSVTFNNLKIHSGETHLDGDVSFPHARIGEVFDSDLSDEFNLSFRESQLEAKDLFYFTGSNLPIAGAMGFRGQLKGNISDLKSDAFFVKLSDSTSVNTSFRLQDPLDLRESKVDMIFRSTNISLVDVKNFLPGLNYPAFLNNLHQTSLKGRFKGNYYDFNLDATVKDTSLGSISTIIKVQLPPVAKDLSYQGIVLSNNLNLNAMGLKSTLDSRRLNMDIAVDGTGSSRKTALVKVKGHLVDSELMGRKIDSVFADIKVENDALVGKLFGKDKDGQANLDVNIDRNHANPIYAATGTVTNFNLARYGLYEKNISVSTKIDGKLLGEFPDDISGNLKIQDLQILEHDKQEQLDIPSIFFSADKLQNKSKYYNLKSSILDADVTGTLNLSQGYSLIKILAKETQLFFENNDSLNKVYYSNKVIDSTEVSGNFALAPKEDLSRIFELLDIPIQSGSQGLAHGSFAFGQFEQINMVMTLDSIRYKDFSLRNSKLDVEVFKLAENEKLAVVGALRVDSMLLPRNGKLEDISFNLDGFEQSYESTFIASQSEYNNRVQLQLKTLFAQDGSIRSAVNPNNSLLVVRGDTLVVTQEDSIIYSLEDRLLDIQGLMMANGNSYIRAEGIISPNPADVISLELSRLDLNLVRDLYPANYFPTGKLNATVSMQNLMKDPVLDSYLRIDSLGIDNFHYGNIFGNLSWQQSENIFRIKSQLYENQGDTTLVLDGTYAVDKVASPLYLELSTIKAFPLEYAYPFVKKQLYGIKGDVKLDKFSIAGTLDNFQVNGVGYFSDAGFGVDYFKTEYTFDGSIAFNNNRIDFPRIQLYDKHKNHADFYGYIYHEGLKRFDFNLQLDKVKNFLVMDTDKGDNELFYGKIFVKDGIADINGDLDKLVINAIASSGSGSYLKVPVSDESEFGRPDYITFIGDEDSKGPVNTGLKGFEINLTTVVTEETEIELIFDERVGDIIQGRGNGSLTMKVNTEGEFNMDGAFEITDGNYLFTAQNVFNKKFNVKQGGRIIWSGDPYDAKLNLEAVYPLYADIREVINEENSVKVPVHVLMKMQGSLLEPNIQLEIELPNMSSSDIPQVASYLKTITYDEQELNKQVFSLMLFNRFAPTGGFLTGQDAASLGVTTSISEMLSNQLNYWLSRAVNDKLSVNLGTTNFKDVNLLVSAKLFNDRVIIERDGNLVSTDSNLTLGNLSVIIKLLPRANNSLGPLNRGNELVLEVFNRESVDSELYNNNSQTGLGIFYKKDFDKLRNIFKSKKR